MKHLGMTRGSGTSTDKPNFKEFFTAYKTIYINIAIQSTTIDQNILALNLDHVDDATIISSWEHAFMNGSTMLHSTIVNPFDCLLLVLVLSKLLLFNEIVSQPKKIHLEMET